MSEQPMSLRLVFKIPDIIKTIKKEMGVDCVIENNDDLIGAIQCLLGNMNLEAINFEKIKGEMKENETTTILLQFAYHEGNNKDVFLRQVKQLQKSINANR